MGVSGFASSLHRWTRHLSVAARPTPPKKLHSGVSHNHKILDCGSPFAANVWDAFQGLTFEERPCFGVRAAERSADAALVLPPLVLPQEANPIRIPFSSRASRELPRNPQRGPPHSSAVTLTACLPPRWPFVSASNSNAGGASDDSPLAPGFVHVRTGSQNPP